MISPDGGGLLLGEVEASTGIVERLAEQFADTGQASRVFEDFIYRTRTLRANQIRLYFASFAYVLLCALRRLRAERHRA